MGAQTAAGTKFYIGPVAAATVDTESEFAALTYTEVKNVENIGRFGGEFKAIDFIALGDRLVQKFKGSEDPGTIDVPMAFDSTDAGQAALVAAFGSDAEYAFKVELNDEITTNPTTFYFKGRVMSNSREIGGADNIVMRQVSIGITTRPIEEAAA
jgi:hypothetical protein